MPLLHNFLSLTENSFVLVDEFVLERIMDYNCEIIEIQLLQ